MLSLGVIFWCQMSICFLISEARSAFAVCLLGTWESRELAAWMNLRNHETHRETAFIPSCRLQLCSLQFLWLPKPSTWVVSKSIQNPFPFFSHQKNTSKSFQVEKSLFWNCGTICPAFEISGCGFAKICLYMSLRKADASPVWSWHLRHFRNFGRHNQGTLHFRSFHFRSLLSLLTLSRNHDNLNNMPGELDRSKALSVFAANSMLANCIQMSFCTISLAQKSKMTHPKEKIHANVKSLTSTEQDWWRFYWSFLALAYQKTNDISCITIK